MWNLNNNDKTKFIDTESGLVNARGREWGWAKGVKDINRYKLLYLVIK